MRDTLIANGLIIDGTGAPPFAGDILVEGDRIRRVAKRGEREREEQASRTANTLDATGLVVSPGFIDIHSHSDHTLVVDPRAFSSVNQGVTLEVVGNCGFGCFPVEDAKLALSRVYAYHDVSPISWKTAEEYFNRLDEGRPAINVASLVANGQLRLAAVGPGEQPATPSQLRRMRELLDQSLEAGAWGISTCLESGEEHSLTEDDVAELLRSVAEHDGIHAAHTRDRANRAPEAIEEAIRTAKRAGARLQVSHLIPDGGFTDMERCIAVVDAATSTGSDDVTFDMHTRLFGIGYLYAAVPPSWLQGPTEEVRARLQDRELRRELRNYENYLSKFGDWSRILILDNDVWPEYGRRSVAEIAEDRRAEPLDAICDLLAATPDDVSRLWTIELTFTEDEQREAFAHPLCVPASDAAALALDGPLAESRFHGAYSWASWFYRYMVRDNKLLSPETAIHKLTGQPASILRLKDRGVIREGAFADIAVFDASSFADRETMFDPNRPAVGMRHVLVNGVVAMRDGTVTGRRGGRVLRKGRTE